MSELQYVSVDRILNKLYRDLRDTSINETDVIEWIGEALDFLKVGANQEQAVAFIEVKDYQADVPFGLQTVLQIARNNNFVPGENNICPSDVVDTVVDLGPSIPVPLDCNGTPLTDYDLAYYRPYFDLQWEYQPWTASSYYNSQYTPVRLANNTLFKTLVSKEKGFEDLYQSCEDEYTISGTIDKRFQFSFKEGSVAVSYLRNAIDPNTGYPLVPDQISYITAITYYIKWKIAEWWSWNNRDGAVGLAQDSERKWLKYCRQAKNWSKMPKSIDQYQNLLEESHYLIPRLKRYYGFFGNLGRLENRQFNDPDYRRSNNTY